MDGKVLKITPNTRDVAYDCNGYITLRTPIYDATWYAPGFKSGKYYAISFDYMTEGTSSGTFALQGFNGTLNEPLLLGAENDGILHSVRVVVPYEALGQGMKIYAKFGSQSENAPGSNGIVYLDNIMVTQLNSILSVTDAPDYSLGTSDYVFSVNSTIDFDLFVGDTELQYVRESNGKIKISASDMEKLVIGDNELVLKTAIYDVKFSVNVSNDGISTLDSTVIDFKYYETESVRLSGSFDEGVRVVGLYMLDKHDRGGYEEARDYNISDLTKNYADRVNLVNGLNGEGYIDFDIDFLNKFYTTTEFSIEFSTGKKQTITLNSDVVVSSNYDESFMFSYINGSPDNGGPLNSGMHSAKYEWKERSEGNTAMYVTSTEGCADAAVFCVRMHDHPWAWYTAAVDTEKLIRITFTYQMNGLDNQNAYFYIFKEPSEDNESNFYGNYEVDTSIGFYIMRYTLINDGKVHTFDSGWFTYDGTLRLTKVQLPYFSEAEGVSFMIDDYLLTQTERTAEYTKGQDEDIVIKYKGIVSAKLDGVEYGSVENNVLTFDKSKLDALSLGQHIFKIENEDGSKYNYIVNVIGSERSVLTETSKTVSNDQDNVKLQGIFDEGLTIVSIKRKGAGDWDTSNTNSTCVAGAPKDMKTSYIIIESDGLVLSADLISQVYGTCEYEVVLSNGKILNFSLTSNMLFYTNMDETYMLQGWSGAMNIVMCQDTGMIEVVEDEDGNHQLKYDPNKATLGHALGEHCKVFTFCNISNGDTSWWGYNLDLTKKLIVTFDYEISRPEGSEAKYAFMYIDTNQENHVVELEDNSGHFSIELDIADLRSIAIGCVRNNGAEVGTYMCIDNYGFGYKA